MFEKIYIVAEAGSNHNGNLKTALELVNRAKEAGADAIKFQDYTLSSLFSVKHYEEALKIKDSSWQRAIYNYSFKPEWHKIIFRESEKAGITYFSTPFSLEAVDILEEYTPFYKIASGDITFIPLIDKIASKGKGVFLSTGSATVREIDQAVNTLKKYNLPFICIMHCVMLYPPPPSTLNLRFIHRLKQRYNLPVGFSDHSLGIDASILSVGLGINALERHLTLNKQQEGSDHRNSIDPDEFSDLVKRIRLCEKILGKAKKVVSEREKRERIYARRGIYAKRDIKKGERLSLENVTFLRPKIFFGAERFNEFQGMIAVKDIPKGTVIGYPIITKKDIEKIT